LSERELEVLRLIVAGYSNREIADHLVLAVSTVKWYINAIYGKLQVASRTKAIARARERNIM
jgi:LuxR family maltose regulon positive regulatory protein